MAEEKVKVSQPHWYRTYCGECPVCGRDQSYRQRVAGEKPQDLNERFVQLPYSLTYDYCDSF